LAFSFFSIQGIFPNLMRKKMPIRVGVDSGGTFTDFVVYDGQKLSIFKLPSTPANPSISILRGLERIAEEYAVKLTELSVVHGTTVGTNALLQRKGGRIALITTKGFEDVLAIGRQARPLLYDLNVTRPEPLVPATLRFGIDERVTSSGEVIKGLSHSEISRVIKQIKKRRVEAIAVSLLFSFANPEHEQLLYEDLKDLNLPLSLSSRIHPEYREFERTSTVVINGYLQPVMGTYLKGLTRAVPDLRVMQSSGGSISADSASEEPVRTVLSGPAGGVVGLLQTATVKDIANYISFDMGGTSTDVSLCPGGEMVMTTEAAINGLPVSIPMLDIQTVGAGGGSIARVDTGGSLRVGPESAGADPGPACYGKSLFPTVTDANLLLNRFGSDSLLGGEFKLDRGAAQRAIEQLSSEISKYAKRSVDIYKTASGILDVVNVHMERAIRSVSVERGFDTRNCALVSFGGAGGLHAVELARSIKIPLVIVPKSPGALSALGSLGSDVVKEWSRTIMVSTLEEWPKRLERAFRSMQEMGQRILLSEGFSLKRQNHKRSVKMRYKGQSFDLTVDYIKGEELIKAFHRAHKIRYGYSQEENEVEIVSANLRSIGLVDRIKLPRTPPVKAVGAKERVKVFYNREQIVAHIYDRDNLSEGARLNSPCIIREYSSTTFVPPGASIRIDKSGNLLITP
jgi:N-methylhydantoinase A